MRKSKSKLVPLLLGALALAVIVPLAARWKDVYCLLFLHPQMVGQWETSPNDPYSFEFDRIGNVLMASSPRYGVPVGTYRVEGGSFVLIQPELKSIHLAMLIVSWSGDPRHEECRKAYRVEGNVLTVGEGNNQMTYRRVPKGRPRP